MQSPYDKLFHFTFRHAKHAASWLCGITPPDPQAIDWSTLTAIEERLPGLWLRPHLADRVFVAALKDGSGFVLILVEHKSHDDPEVGAEMRRPGGSSCAL